MFLFVLKKGPYILIWAYNELNPIHWAQTPNRDIAARRKAFRVSVHAIHSPMLCKVVSTVMVLYCDWSSGVTAGKSMGFFERQNRCRCVHLSPLQAFLSMHLNLSFMSKSVLSMLKQVSPCLSCHSPPPHTQMCMPHKCYIKILGIWTVTQPTVKPLQQNCSRVKDPSSILLLDCITCVYVTS